MARERGEVGGGCRWSHTHTDLELYRDSECLRAVGKLSGCRKPRGRRQQRGEDGSLKCRFRATLEPRKRLSAPAYLYPCLLRSHAFSSSFRPPPFSLDFTVSSSLLFLSLPLVRRPTSSFLSSHRCFSRWSLDLLSA